VPSELIYDADLNTVMERSQPTAIARKKCPQMVDDLVYQFFEVNNCMDGCLKLKHGMEAAMAPYKDVYKHMQKMAHKF
jgi:hypothetical protein